MGEFKNQGYLAPAMVNFLSLLGWNDGTEQEVFTVRGEGGRASQHDAVWGGGGGEEHAVWGGG